MSQIPTIGRIVHYTLAASDADQINGDRLRSVGRTGNRVQEGDVYPMMITRAWGTEFNSYVNGQVFLDGNDIHWVSSVSVGEGPRHFAWPSRA